MLVPDIDPGGDGCGGGQMDEAFHYFITKKKDLVLTEASYPYASGADGETGCCLAPFAKKLAAGVGYGARVVNYTDVAHDEASLAAALAAHGPISIAVDAGHTWKTYQGGILDNCTLGNKPQLDHGVLLVAMTADYWVVKNSWGKTWGEEGFIRIAKGGNQCGLANSPVYPTVDTTTPLPAPIPPLPKPKPKPGCPDGFTCFGVGEEAQFLAKYLGSSCGDKLALIGTTESPAVLDASMSKSCPPLFSVRDLR